MAQLVHLMLLTTVIFVLIQAGKLLLEANHSTTEVEVNRTAASTLRLLTILPYPVSPSESGSQRPSWDEGPAVLLAVKLAVKHINQDQYTLPGYRIEQLDMDGGCNVYTKAITVFTEYVHRGPPIAGVIGPGCSDSSLAVSSLFGRPEIHLPNIHFATSPLLEDRKRYRNSYGIVGSSIAYIKAAISLIDYNDWEDVAILYDSTSSIHLNKRLRELVSRVLDKNKVTFFSAVYDMYLPHDALTQNSVKVVITLTELNHTLKLLCIAHKRGMVFPWYQWVIVGHHFREIEAKSIHGVAFRYGGVFYNCTYGEILKNNLLLNYRLETRDKVNPLVSGYTYNGIVRQYAQEIFDRNNKYSTILPSIWATVAYDSVWALVLALNVSARTFNISTQINSLQLGNKNFTDNIKHNLDKIRFMGVSGEIDFDGNIGFIHRTVDIRHINGTMDANLVAFVRKGNISTLTDYYNPRIFINTTHIVRAETVYLPLALFFLFVILVLCLATFLLHILSILKRRHPLVKASSLILNHFVFFGCYVWTAGSLIYIIVLKTLSYEHESTYANCCQAIWAWLLPIGCTLTFGTLVVKTWRIYRIFIHFQDPGHLISNQVLITLVFVQLSFDVALATIWSIISPAHLQKTVIEQTANEDNRMTYITKRSCIFIDVNGGEHNYWIAISYSYKAVQMLLLLLLTLLTRKIQNKKFNTFLLRQASYSSFVLFVTVIPPFTVLWYFNAEIHADFILMCVLIIGTISICFSFVLLRPILPILKQVCAYFQK